MIATLLSNSLNRLLQQDAATKEKLSQLENKVVTLQCLLPIPITLQCTVIQENIVIKTGNTLLSHTTIAGTPMQLFRTGILQATSDAFQLDDVTIEGDTELAEKWLRLFREADIDLEESLATLMGDIPAHKAGQLLKHVKKFVTGNIRSFETSMNEYLHEETDWFPTKESLQHFFDDVDKIRLDTDRLNAKIILFKQAIEG